MTGLPCPPNGRVVSFAKVRAELDASHDLLDRSEVIQIAGSDIRAVGQTVATRVTAAVVDDLDRAIAVLTEQAAELRKYV
ncbi:MAG: hypothetical protein GY788_04690 [bacterium]|nr:hypothetical protein [bacterium]